MDSMKPIVFHYQIGLSDYRKMLYFNTFSLRKLQNVLMASAWAAAVILLMLDLTGAIEASPILHLCFLVVSVSVPMIIVSLEIRVYRSKNAEVLSEKRMLTIEQDGLRYSSEGDRPSGLDKWDDLLAIYETKSNFLVYKDTVNIVLIPKKGLPEDKLLQARGVFEEKMGKHFRLRCKQTGTKAEVLTAE